MDTKPAEILHIEELPRRRRRLPEWVTEPAAWGGLAVLAMALVLVGIVLWLAWLLVTTLVDGAGRGLAAAGNALTDAARWLADGPITRTIVDPIHSYLDAHATGLPATAGQLWWTWVVAVAVLFVTALLGSRGARIGWVLAGALTTAMVYGGTAGPGRTVAAGVTVLAWALLSVPAFTGAGRLCRGVTVINHPERHGDEPAAA